MKKAIEDYIEPFLRKNLELKKGINELGAGHIILDKNGNINTFSAIVEKLIPEFKNRKFLINKNLSSEIIESNKKYVKILTIPIKDTNGEIKGATCFVADITLEIELDKEMDETFSKIINQNKELSLTEEKLRKSQEEIDKKVEYLEDSELATLNIMEDFQDTIKKLEEAEKEIKDLNLNLEKKVDERTSEVQKLLKQKDEFIYQLGHDLKTPLTPITTLLPMVKQKINDKKVQEFIDISIKNASYMDNLVKKTLKLSEINSPTEKLNMDDIKLSEEINKIIKNKQSLIKEKDIKIENLVDDKIYVKADKLRLNDIIDNIFSNSISYSKENTKITINAEKNKDKVTISIADNGIGLSKDQIKNIFDEFYKADESRHDIQNTGLGLSICKKIVEKHGGKIWVESPGLGKGSTFYFTLKKGKK